MPCAAPAAAPWLAANEPAQAQMPATAPPEQLQLLYQQQSQRYQEQLQQSRCAAGLEFVTDSASASVLNETRPFNVALHVPCGC